MRERACSLRMLVGSTWSPTARNGGGGGAARRPRPFPARLLNGGPDSPPHVEVVIVTVMAHRGSALSMIARSPARCCRRGRTPDPGGGSADRHRRARRGAGATVAEELNEAGATGYRFRATQGGETAFGGRGVRSWGHGARPRRRTRSRASSGSSGSRCSAPASEAAKRPRSSAAGSRPAPSAPNPPGRSSDERRTASATWSNVISCRGRSSSETSIEISYGGGSRCRPRDLRDRRQLVAHPLGDLLQREWGRRRRRPRCRRPAAGSSAPG